VDRLTRATGSLIQRRHGDAGLRPQEWRIMFVPSRKRSTAVSTLLPPVASRPAATAFSQALPSFAGEGAVPLATVRLHLRAIDGFGLVPLIRPFDSRFPMALEPA